MFSGGVSEFIYNRSKSTFGDLGPLIADEVHQRMADLDLLVMEPNARIRATVIGASQYTVQVSGNTIFIAPEDAVPVRNVGVVAPEFPLNQDDFTKEQVRDALLSALRRLDLLHGRQPVAVAFHWGRLSDLSPAASVLQRRRRRSQRYPGQRSSAHSSQ
jgi:ethanolamine utilization protein EutA